MDFASDLTSGDFNRDGWPDLAVANASDAGVTIFLNRSGAMQLGGAYPVLGQPRALTAVDLNGDGFADLATGLFTGDSESWGSLSLLISKGDGTFWPASSDQGPCSVLPGGIKAVYFDGGQPPSIVCTGLEGLEFFRGIGDGGLAPPVALGGSGYGALAIGDFNRDGLPDIAAAVLSIGGVRIFESGEDGGINLLGTYPAPGLTPLWDIVAGDLNGDRVDDLAVAASGQVGMLLAVGDGTFYSWSSFAVLGSVNAVAIADLDGDGTNEVLYAAGGLYQLQAGLATHLLDSDDGILRLVVDDFNRDGAPDIAALRNSSVSVYLNGCP